MMRATAFLAVALLVFLGQPCGSLASRNLQAASAPAVAPLAPKTSILSTEHVTPGLFVCRFELFEIGHNSKHRVL